MSSRRAKVLAEPFEAERVAIIERNVPYFGRLSEDDRRELLGHVRVFLAEKKFEGCGGLELTDEMKLTIAAQACLLLLHRETDYYPDLDVILVYPSAYRATQREHAGGRAVLERDQVRLGESNQRGIVVLSWDAVKRGAADPADGHNVVLHEFAHKLDEEDGAADGVPVLERRSSYGPWARVFTKEFEALSKATEEGRETDIDSYAATNPAEFFAVITEEFFETPETLAENHPHLYEQLVAFYKQDPLARLGVEFTPPPPLAEPIKAKAPGPIVLYKTPSDPSANANALRGPLLALGAKPCGFLETVHGAISSSFVCEVYGCPDASVVAATYHFERFGDGVAFWTLLENGTVITTETCAVRSFDMKMTRVLPFGHPREHQFVVSLALAPAELYAAHRERVRRISERERTKPLERDPFLTYAACRTRSIGLLAQTVRDLFKLQPPVAVVMFVVTAILVARRADQLNRGVIAVAFAAGALVAMIFSGPVARFLQNRRFRSPPVPPDELFARAAAIDTKAPDDA